MRRMWRVVLVLVSMAAVALPVAEGGFATAGAAGSLAPHVSVLRNGRAVQSTANSMQAGYVTLAANQTEVKGRFVLPNFTCTGTQAFDLSIQLEGPPSSAVGFITVTCSGTGELPTFQGFACAGTSGTCSTEIAPVPGDTITITDSLTESLASAVVHDQTTNMNTSMTGAGATTTTNSNFIDQRESSTIPTFGQAIFKHCTVNGMPISANNPVSGPMTNGSGKTQVKVGPLNNAGTGFTTTFSHR